MIRRLVLAHLGILVALAAEAQASSPGAALRLGVGASLGPRAPEPLVLEGHAPWVEASVLFARGAAHRWEAGVLADEREWALVLGPTIAVLPERAPRGLFLRGGLRVGHRVGRGAFAGAQLGLGWAFELGPELALTAELGGRARFVAPVEASLGAALGLELW